MSSAFETIMWMSVQGSLLTVVALAARILVRRGAPQLLTLVWVPILFRWLCPWGISSPSAMLDPGKFMLSPAAWPTTPNALANVQSVDKAQATVSQLSLASLLGLIWIVGAFVAAYVTVRRYSRCARALSAAKPIGERVYTCAGLQVPFVFGVLHPRIYLPEGLDAEYASSVILHEQAHIRRGDIILRVVFSAARVVQWFNPVVYIADRLCRADMEMACDATALRCASPHEKATYATALLRFAGASRFPVPGEGFAGCHTKERIEYILNTKKPTVVATAAAVICCFVLVACAAVAPTVTAPAVHPADEASEMTDTGYDEPAEFNATENLNGSKRESNGEEFARLLSRYLPEYKKYGITYRDGDLYYKDQKIREFIDGYVTNHDNGERSVIARFAVSTAEGEVDVFTERDADTHLSDSTVLFGPITGLHVEPAVLEQDSSADGDGTWWSVDDATEFAGEYAEDSSIMQQDDFSEAAQDTTSAVLSEN